MMKSQNTTKPHHTPRRTVTNPGQTRAKEILKHSPYLGLVAHNR